MADQTAKRKDHKKFLAYRKSLNLYPGRLFEIEEKTGVLIWGIA